MNHRERVELLPKLLNMTLNEIGIKIGDTNGDRFYKILRNRNGISKKLTNDLLLTFPQLNEIWLLTGTGEPLIELRQNVVSNTPNEQSGFATYYPDKDSKEMINNVYNKERSDKMINEAMSGEKKSRRSVLKTLREESLKKKEMGFLESAELRLKEEHAHSDTVLIAGQKFRVAPEVKTLRHGDKRLKPIYMDEKWKGVIVDPLEEERILNETKEKPNPLSGKFLKPSAKAREKKLKDIYISQLENIKDGINSGMQNESTPADSKTSYEKEMAKQYNERMEDYKGISILRRSLPENIIKEGRLKEVFDYYKNLPEDHKDILIKNPWIFNYSLKNWVEQIEKIKNEQDLNIDKNQLLKDISKLINNNETLANTNSKLADQIIEVNKHLLKNQK